MQFHLLDIIVWSLIYAIAACVELECVYLFSFHLILSGLSSFFFILNVVVCMRLISTFESAHDKCGFVGTYLILNDFHSTEWRKRKYRTKQKEKK